MPPVAAALAVLAAYLVGTFPSAQLAGSRRGIDPTRSGSGNPGTTNVLRTAGPSAAVLTLAGDLAKGAVPAAAGWLLGGHMLGVICGVAAVAGHVAPATRSFQGGKGVATAVGMMAVLFPQAALAGLLAFGAGLGLTRIAAAGSLAGTAAGLGVAIATGVPAAEAAALVICAVMIVVRHRDNLRRIVRGDERRTSLHGQ